MTITEKYKGFDVAYDSEDGVWRCGTLEASQLKALRAKIDEAERAGRRLDVKALYIDAPYYRNEGKATLKPCRVTMRADNGRYWAVIEGRETRERVGPSELLPDTDKARAAFEKWRAVAAEIDELRARERDLREKFPPFEMPEPAK